jgi:hypothetical protein
MSVIIIHENCEPHLAKNRDLPRNSYLVTYVRDEEIQYDIVQSGARVHIFDHYYDKYGEVRGIKWTEGTINPKLWNYQAPDSNKKKKR